MNAEEVYANPSALAALYIHEAASRSLFTWRAKLDGGALELKLRHFLTFDARQQKLAMAVGLKLVRL